MTAAKTGTGAKIIVITGASSGIGEAAAKRLAKDGHTIVLAARRQPELDRVAREIDGRTLTVAMDVTMRSDVDRLRDDAMRTFGRVDVWINNAGRGITRNVLNLTDDDMDDMFSVNVMSVLYGTQAIVPYFMEQGSGQLINVSSFLARVPIATFRSAYNAAKAAVNALTANLRVDLAASHPGIHVTLIMPGVVTTDFSKNARASDGRRMTVPTAYPLQPQTPEEVAEVFAEVVARPVAEVFTNPAAQAVVQKYYDDVAAFETANRAAARTV